VPRGKKYTDEKIPPPRPFRSPQFLSRLFVFLAKPVYSLSLFLIDTLLLIPHITGQVAGTKIRPLFTRFFKKAYRFRSQIRKKIHRYGRNTAKLSKKIKIVLSRHKQKKQKRKKSGTTNIELIHITKRSFFSAFFVRIFIGISLFVFLVGMASGGAFYYFIVKDLPNPKNLTDRILPASTKIFDRNGVLLYTIYKDRNRTPIQLSEIPPQMKLATIAVEDADFYEHPGFSVRGILRSLAKNLESGQLTGGSTITQQLVKNALLTPEKTIVRKMKEVTLAILVEQHYSKNEILEMYLNEVPFGGTAYGVQEASKTFFGKDVKDINLAEAALLAGLPRSPTQYSPYGSNPERARARQLQVLSLMEANAFITHEQFLDAQNTKLVFAEHKTDIKAPHFVAYVREVLENTYGKELVENGGLLVTTSLDYSIQLLAEKIVKEEVDKLNNLRVGNGAALVLHPQTGEILAMVGSRDYFDLEHDGNVNVTLRPRQPGSSIKIVNYAYALSHGMTPATMLEDSPITFLTDGQPPYTPKNYEGGFRGNITLRSALAESRNIPAVKVLHTNGIRNMIELGTKMGVTSWNNPDNYGLSLTLGGGEVRLLDLARVYATIANYGNKPPIVPILRVTNYKGIELDQEICAGDEKMQIAEVPQSSRVSPTPTTTTHTSLLLGNPVSAATQTPPRTRNTACLSSSVLDPRVAFQITDILKDNSARTPSFGSNSLLVIPKHPEAAVKTGTSNDLRDNVTVGYTKDYLVAVWVGNNNNAPMGRIASGVTGASPIWNKILSSLLSEKPTYEWPTPQGMQKISVCGRKEEWFLEENKPSLFCNPEWISSSQTSDKKPKPEPSVTPPMKPKPQIIDLREGKVKRKERR
jgi:membrane peptidoglycan carboxypeptidase